MKNILTKALLSTAFFSTLIIASDLESASSSALSTRTTPHVVKKVPGKAQKLRSLIYAAGADCDEYDGVVPDPESLLAEKLTNLSIGEDSDDEFSGARCRPMAGKKDLVQGLKRKSPTATTRVQTAYETQLIAKIKATSKNVTIYTPDTLPKTAKEVTNGAYIVLNLSDILISGVGATKYGFKMHLKDIVESRADIHIVVICDVDRESLCLNSFTKINNRPAFVVQHLPQMVEHVELHDPEGKITTLSSGLLAGHPKLQTVVFKGFHNLRHIEAGVGINSPSVSKIDLSNLVNLETVGDGFFSGHDSAVVDLKAQKKLTSVGLQFLKPKQLREEAKFAPNGKKMIPQQRQAVTGYAHLNDDVQMALYHSYEIPEVRQRLAEAQYDEEVGCCGCFGF